jgi:LAS superfamily LD-carboxypeptidase LdcB
VERSASSSVPARRARGIVLVGLALLVAAIGAFVVERPLVASAPSSSSAEVGPPKSRHTALGEADGVVPDGASVSVFDGEVPAVGKLDSHLRDALRRAATDAESNGVDFRVNSGWRSRAYQEQLWQDAVVKYGSQQEAARWVATPETSAHVQGAAVDLGPFDADTWLSRHGAGYGLCQIYGNEPWHYELRPDAVDDGCPPMYADAAADPRMHP